MAAKSGKIDIESSVNQRSKVADESITPGHQFMELSASADVLVVKDGG
jgi:hypothetical protein